MHCFYQTVFNLPILNEMQFSAVLDCVSASSTRRRREVVETRGVKILPRGRAKEKESQLTRDKDLSPSPQRPATTTTTFALLFTITLQS